MNPELRGTTARELIRALEADGFDYVRSKGSHRVYRHADSRRVVVAYHRPGAMTGREYETAATRQAATPPRN